jgi:hypothetical protein
MESARQKKVVEACYRLSSLIGTQVLMCTEMIDNNTWNKVIIDPSNVM